MSRARLLFGAFFGACVVTFGVAVAQQVEIPAGPDRNIVSRECGACHDLGMVVGAAGQTREGWSSTIDEMISYGMRVEPEDRAKILDYLSTFLGTRPAPNPAAR